MDSVYREIKKIRGFEITKWVRKHLPLFAPVNPSIVSQKNILNFQVVF